MLKVFFIFILIFLGVIYRQAIFGNKIVFPANYLASFYSPWSTEKFPGWEQGIPNRPIGGDLLRFFYPGQTFTIKEIKAGRVPLWNPYIFAGNPHLANFQSAVFYPLNWLYLFLPQLTAWSILIIVQPLLATIFCYLFLKSLPIKKGAAVFGAFAFGFSGFVVTWSQEAIAVGHSALWLPLILYGLERKRFWVTTIALSLSILAGYLQTTFYISIFATLYAFYRHIEIKRVALIFIFAIGLCAIQIIPSLESFWLSARPTTTIETVFNTYLLPIVHLAKLIAPDINGNPASYNYFGKGSYNETVLFIGVVPLVFAILAILKNKGNGLIKFFFLSSIISYLLTTDFFLTRWFLHLPIPLIPTFQPSRILVLTTFSLSILTAFGMSRWQLNLKNDYKILKFICLVLVSVLILTLGFYFKTIWMRDFLIVLKNVLLPLAILVFLVLKRPSLLLIAILTILGQFYFFYRYLNLGNKQFLYPKTTAFEYLLKESGSLDRFIAFDKPILGNFATQFRLFSPEGYDPIFSKRYGQLIYSSRDFMNGKLSEDIPRVEVMLSHHEKNPENQRRSRLLSLLGVKNVLNFNGQWQFMENEQALPRAFLASNMIVETDPRKILDKIFDSATDLSQTLVLEEPIAENLSKTPGTAQIISYQPQSVGIKTNAVGPKLLFLSDNYYPGWKAVVDGQQTKIYRADFAFRAVLIPPGKHLVNFYYQPESFEIGKWITMLMLLSLLVQKWRLGYPFDEKRVRR